MPIVSIPQTSFTGGEWAPSLFARNDLAKAATAARTMRNGFPHPHGGYSNRGGTEFIAETKDSTKESRLIPFQFSTVQAYMLEFGDQYMRIIKDGGQVLNSSRDIVSLVSDTYKWTPSAFGALVPETIRSVDFQWTLSTNSYSVVSLNDNAGWSKVENSEGLETWQEYSLTTAQPTRVTEKGEAKVLSEVTPGDDLALGEWYYTGGAITLRLSDDRSPNSHGSGYVRGQFRYTYYLEAVGGGDPSKGIPFEIQDALGSVSHISGVLGELEAGEWAYGDYDSLGYDTIYLRLDSNTDPDAETVDSINAAYAEEYYLEISEGGTPALQEPTYVYEDTDTLLVQGEPGILGLAEWGYGDNDSLGYDTIYVRLTEGNGPDPGGEASGFVEAQYHTAIPMVDPNEYEWSLSGSGSNEYYAEVEGGGDPSLDNPVLAYEDGVQATEGTVGSLGVGEWAYGDNDTLGFSTIYFRLTDEVDPSTKKNGYIEAGYIAEIETPYQEADLSLLKFVQSNDTLYITHPSYQVRKLSRRDHDIWDIERIDFGADIEAPTNLASASGTGSFYAVTAVDANERESVASASVEGAPGNALTWDTVLGALYYNIYKDDNESDFFGWIGQAESLTFTEPTTKIIPDQDESPPKELVVFEGKGNYPGVCTFFEQRFVTARTDNDPQDIWGSRTADFENFNESRPLKDDDSYNFTINSRNLNEIKWMVPLNELIIGTSGSEWKMSSGGQSNAVTPTSVNMKMQTQYGVSDLQPIVVGNTVLFLEAAGSVVRDLQYSYEVDSHVGNDLSILANHLFRGFSITDWCYQRDPNSIVWAVRSDGVLLGLTYVKSQQVSGWHRHDTSGLFERVASLRTNSGEDAVYFIVKRTIDGVDKRYIEKLSSRIPVNSEYEFKIEDAYFVDCGLTYDGAPATVISGLDHLEGESIVALADGNVIKGLTVTSGTIELDNPASKVHLGLSYYSDLETLDVDYAAESGTIQDKRKHVPSVVLRMENTRAAFVGPDVDSLTEIAFREDEDYGEPTALFTGDKEVNIDAGAPREARVFVRNIDPLPMTILAIITRVDHGES